MKKNIALLSAVLILSGCASTMATQSDSPFAQTTSAINRDMSKEDQTKLMQLISVSKVNSNESWDSYEFKTLKVYVNDQGQVCRNYQLTRNAWVSTQEENQTACRDENGVWQIK